MGAQGQRLLVQVDAEPMSGLFNQLPGFQRSAPGMARTILRGLPRITLLGTAAFSVMVMKGPAYVADPYPLSDTDRPS